MLNNQPRKPFSRRNRNETKLAALFFKKSAETDDIKLGYTPKEDFSDKYTDNNIDEEVENLMKEDPDKFVDIVLRNCTVEICRYL